MPADQAAEISVDERRGWMSVLALATGAELEAVVGALGSLPPYEFLRRPEAGSVLVRGRIGGTGRPFNVGEMTVARCTVQIPGGAAGTAYVAGTDLRHAELAAVVDALMQDPDRRLLVAARVVEPLAAAQAERADRRRRRAATTRVDFLTLVRGDG